MNVISQQKILNSYLKYPDPHLHTFKLFLKFHPPISVFACKKCAWPVLGKLGQEWGIQRSKERKRWFRNNTHFNSINKLELSKSAQQEICPPFLPTTLLGLSANRDVWANSLNSYIPSNFSQRQTFASSSPLILPFSPIFVEMVLQSS